MNCASASRIGYGILVTTVICASCARTPVSRPVAAQPCRTIAPAGASSISQVSRSASPVAALGLRWVRPQSESERTELNRWCSGVGPPLLQGPPSLSREAAEIDRLPLVAWNVRLGAGDLDRLVADLRSGRLTGSPESHFVLLLQEARRSGGDIPSNIPEAAKSADRIRVSTEVGSATSIERVAARNSLHVFYVPSMRNGRPDDGGGPEDRGNAILSTLPLTRVQAIELPVQSQRRVAAAATVSGSSASGSLDWELRLVSLHLDHRAAWREIHHSLGAGRARQAERLIELLNTEDAIALGGDLNTWLGGASEPAVRLLRDSFPLPRPADVPETPTVEAPFFLPDRTLDHLFFRLPDAWTAHYQVVPDAYGSDHRPLVGWIQFGGESPPPGLRAAQ